MGWRRRQVSINCVLCKERIIFRELGSTEELPKEVSSDGISGILKSPPSISWPLVNSASKSSVLVIKKSWWVLGTYMLAKVTSVPPIVPLTKRYRPPQIWFYIQTCPRNPRWNHYGHTTSFSGLISRMIHYRKKCIFQDYLPSSKCVSWMKATSDFMQYRSCRSIRLFSGILSPFTFNESTFTTSRKRGEEKEKKEINEEYREKENLYGQMSHRNRFQKVLDN